MKILHIMPFIPTPEGPVEGYRAFHMLRTMSERHRITVVAFGSPGEHELLKRHFHGALHGVHIVPFRWRDKYPRIAQLYAMMAGRTYRKRMQRTLDILLFENDYDLIHADFPVMGMFQFDSNAITVLDYHTQNERLLRRMFQQLASPFRLFNHAGPWGERVIPGDMALCSRFDVVLVANERLKRQVRRATGKEQTFVVPTGIEIPAETPSLIGVDPFSLFVLDTTGRGSSQMLVPFFHESLSLVARAVPKLVVYVSDEGLPGKLRRFPGMTVVPVCKKDTNVYLQRATVTVAPSAERAVTSQEILGAMALRKPVIATRLASEGIDANHGQSIIRESGPERFAAAILDMLRDPGLRKRIGDGGYELVRTRYDWHTIGDKIDAIYETLFDKQPTAFTKEEKVENPVQNG